MQPHTDALPRQRPAGEDPPLPQAPGRSCCRAGTLLAQTDRSVIITTTYTTQSNDLALLGPDF